MSCGDSWEVRRHTRSLRIDEVTIVVLMLCIWTRGECVPLLACNQHKGKHGHCTQAVSGSWAYSVHQMIYQAQQSFSNLTPSRACPPASSVAKMHPHPTMQIYYARHVRLAHGCISYRDTASVLYRHTLAADE